MNPLDQLRDIHLPDSVQWWPLAIGWWLLAALMLMLVLLFVWRFNRGKKQRRMVNLSMQSLDALEADTELDEEEWLRALSALLRRVVINLHGRKATAGLVGKQWLEYLDRYGKNNSFSEGEGRLLATQPYQAAANYDRKELSALVRNWIKSQTNMSNDTQSGNAHSEAPAQPKIGAKHA